MSVTTAVVGRQPVVDRDGQVVGYELLFRPLPSSQQADDPVASVVLDGDEMTSEVIFSALGIGIRQLAGGKTVFCNADRGVFTGLVPMRLPSQQTVIEVLETVTIDDEVLAGCRSLRAAGYRLAADDFIWRAGAEELLGLVDFVKIDIQAMSLSDVGILMDRCRPFGVSLLAEKIEVPEELAACRELGFDLFQGYLIGRPATITGPALTPSRMGSLQLANAVLSDDADYDNIEKALRGEPALAYQLIQLAAIGRLGETKRDVRSVREALVSVGLARLRGWIPALLLRPAGPMTDTNLPAVLGRARLVELLAEHIYPGTGGFGFAAGMLSAFDLLLGIPRHRLPDMLDLPNELRAAAFGGDSDIARLVTDVIAFERYGPSATHLPELAVDALQHSAPRAFSWALRATELIDHLPAQRER